jgi:hypothetical protein
VNDLAQCILNSRFLQSSLLSLLLLGQIGAIFIAAEGTAQAYVDPGSGMMALQVLGASVAGAFYLLRKKARSLFHRSGRERGPNDEGPSPAQPLAGHASSVGPKRKIQNLGE